jgi:hypothetical protein
MFFISIVNIASVNHGLDIMSALRDKKVCALADAIIKGEGSIIRPAIVERTGYDEDGCPLYALVDGEIVFAAYMVARKLNASITSMDAIVIDDENREVIMAQMGVFGKF